MEIYLIRHGIAAARGTYTNDNERPLINKGRQKTKQVAQRLYNCGLRFDVILTSPLVRAKQTAEILYQVGLSSQVQEFAPLAPDGDIQEWINWQASNHYQTVALVGHQPDLGNWAEILLWGVTQEKIVLKKAGVIGLRVSSKGNSLSCQELFLLTSPKWLLT